jgi:hypothetical protein
LAKYNFKITYRKGTKNAKADAFSKRTDFIKKKDKTKTLLKERKKGLKYSNKVATIYEILKNLIIEQRIQDAYKGDTRAKIAKSYKEQRHKGGKGIPSFLLDETGLIRFKEVVYLLKKVKKEFVKEIHKEPLVRHLGINKTREAVTA